jgi:hypothetical protein
LIEPEFLAILEIGGWSLSEPLPLLPGWCCLELKGIIVAIMLSLMAIPSDG